MAGRAREAGRSVTSRVLAALSAFDSEHPRLTLSEVARRSGLPVTTTHRLLGELCSWQALNRRPDGRYEVGHRLWRLGLLAPVHLELAEVAAPYLRDVQLATGAVVHLAVRDGTAALYVESVSGKTPLAVSSRAGSRLPLHATGVGKVLLCDAPPELVADVLAGLTRITPYTISEPGRLRRELAETRRRGYARTVEELVLGASSVAVPVRAGTGPAVAALGVVVTAPGRELTRLVPTLKVAAAAISRALQQS